MQNDDVLIRYERWLRSSSRTDETVALRMRHARMLARRVRLTLADEDAIAQALADTRHLAKSTRHSIMSSWKLLYRWATASRLVMHDPTALLEQVRVPARAPRVAPDRDIEVALLGASPRDRALVMLGRYACLRLSELTSLHMHDRDGDRLRVIGKGDKERDVYVNAELGAALDALERDQPYGYYFPGRDKRGQPMHAQSVHKVIKRLTGWNPHALRHAGATAAYVQTRDLESVRKFLGHANLATTQRYLHVDSAALRAVAAATVIRPTLRPVHPLEPAA
jgi:site-specific recombinase XerD